MHKNGRRNGKNFKWVKLINEVEKRRISRQSLSKLFIQLFLNLKINKLILKKKILAVGLSARRNLCIHPNPTKHSIN